jgi:hypothetical protein
MLNRVHLAWTGFELTTLVHVKIEFVLIIIWLKKIAALESLLKTKFEFCVLYALSQTVFVYNPQDVVNKRLWKENLNGDGKQFHWYQQKEYKM